MKTILTLLILFLIFFPAKFSAQWIQQSLPGDIGVTLGIDFVNQDQGILGGWHFGIQGQVVGNAYYTTNSGTEWVEATIPDSMRIAVDIQMLNDTLAYCAGAYNLPEAYTASNLFRSQEQNQALQKYFKHIGIDFSRQETYRGYFVETTDGGLTWHPKGSFVDSVYYLLGISFVDEQTGYVIALTETALGSSILKTTDGGNTWDFTYPVQNKLFIKDIKFFDQVGYAVGENYDLGYAFVQKTTDGGSTWQDIIYLPGLITINNVSYKDINTIFIAGINSQFEGSLYKSSDGGNTWQEFKTYDDAHYLSGVETIQNSSVLLTYGNYQSSFPFADISLNGGIDWSYVQLSQFQDYLLLYSKMVDQFRWYLTGTQNLQAGFVLFTDNSGGVPVELVSFTAESIEGKVTLKWTTATELNNLGFEIERKTKNSNWRVIGFKEGKGTTTETQSYIFIDDLFGIELECFYYRLKQIDYNGNFEYSDIIETEVKNTLEFSLIQNYPNPFNPNTIIRFTLPDDGFTSLVIYDALGNVVKTLINEVRSAGTYELNFNGSSLAGGIYFYRIRAGDFTEIKKMVLMK